MSVFICEDRKLILLHLVKFSLKEVSAKAVLLQEYYELSFHLNSAAKITWPTVHKSRRQ